MPSQQAAGGHRLLAMIVNNVGFLLDRLGQDCHPLQFVRELTKNSMEAIERSGEPGTIIWDYERIAFELEGLRKLCVIDTGDGMTGEDMVRFINQLSSSASEQSLQGNYGVGAKIAAATRNPAGVSYFSWKNGVGSMIFLFRDELTQQYGLKQWERADGTWTHFLPIEDELKPDIIKDHGTMVVLHGKSPNDDTLFAPDISPAPRRWITRYLNARYFEIPKNITISCREGNLLAGGPADDIGTRRTVLGQAEYLRRYATQSGCVALEGAAAYWWIIGEHVEQQTDPADKYGGHLEARGHTAALYQNELYELTTRRAGMSRLQQFGITFGYDRVVIYVEPKSDARLTTNTARTALLLGNEPLPWDEWAAEFRATLPAALKTFVESRAPDASRADHLKNIRERLKAILDLYKVSRYRPITHGELRIDTADLARGGQPASTGAMRSPSETPVGRERGGSGGKEGNIYALFERKSGAPGEKVEPDLFPKVDWVSVSDGSRAAEDMEDRAAKYLSEQNRLLINAEFRVFRDMTKHLLQSYGQTAGAETVVEDTVRAWFEQALVEAVIGLQALRNSKHWSADEIEKALSEESLTACVMQRYHIYLAAKRELGAKIGSAKQVAA
jgi:Histidine kinase-, DNA gyrase B-, and HSP90-like ATPase